MRDIVTNIASQRDLEQWVSDRVGDGVTDEEIEQIADAIQDIDGCPWWGDNWTDFLETATPENLVDLLD